MTTTIPPTSTDDLGDKLRRLAVWADACPPHARKHVATRVDALAMLLGQVCADRITGKDR